jgi:PST family polysaccharide transporter
MGTDYYLPTAAIRDSATAARLVMNRPRSRLLCAPVLLAMLGLAPGHSLLYSAEFGPAVEILRWQLLGDILKVMSWPLGFVILASGAGKTFVLTESLGMGVFVLGVLIGLPLIGVTATGVACLALYVAYLPIVWWFGRRMIGFRWTRAVKAQALAVMAAAASVDIAARWSEPLGAVLGLGLALATGIGALLRLSTMAGAGGHLGRIAGFGERMKGWMIRR